jgi:MFS transporter, DHA2 family, multidrug resistance protein
VILAVVPILTLLGVLFTMAQCLQSVRGTTAMGSGLRLLRLVAGLVLAAVPTARVVATVGAKVAVTAGFVVRAVGLFIGSIMNVTSSGVFVGMWMAIAGVGAGIAM